MSPQLGMLVSQWLVATRPNPCGCAVRARFHLANDLRARFERLHHNGSPLRLVDLKTGRYDGATERSIQKNRQILRRLV